MPLFKAFTPDFQFFFCDLNPLSDDQIKGTLLTKAVFLTLKSIFRPDFIDVLPRLIQFAKTLDNETTGLQSLEAFLKYFLCASKNLEIEQLKKILENTIPDNGGKIMATIAETLIKQGEELGLKKGEELGIKKGEELGIKKGEELGIRATVKKMLKKGLSLDLISQISELSIDEIKKMATQS